MKLLNTYLKNSCCLIITSLLLVKCSFAQNTASLYQYHDENRSNPAFGSATTLKGTTLVINCFVSDDRKGWSLQNKKIVLAKEQEGFGWLNWHSQKWGVSGLVFNVSNIGLDQDIKLEKISRSEDATKFKDVKWVPLVLNTAGYNDLPAFYDSVKNASKADNIVLLIFAKKASRSFAQGSASNNKTNERFIEGAVIFSETYNGLELTSATIIHEMLHLFGARDIYHDKQIERDEDVEKKMTTVFPNSIMLETYREIGTLQMEQLTAWCIGWTHSYWGWYDLFGHSVFKK